MAYTRITQDENGKVTVEERNMQDDVVDGVHGMLMSIAKKNVWATFGTLALLTGLVFAIINVINSFVGNPEPIINPMVIIAILGASALFNLIGIFHQKGYRWIAITGLIISVITIILVFVLR